MELNGRKQVRAQKSDQGRGLTGFVNRVVMGDRERGEGQE